MPWNAESSAGAETHGLRSVERSPALVVSPHLDDAVFSCGEWMAGHPGCIVVTVFAGTPRDAAMRTPWDLQCGFAHAAEAMAARQHEDASALALLGAKPVWLSFRDAQYGESATPAEVANRLCDVLARLRPEQVLLPLGLFHSDHHLTHVAGCLTVARAIASGVLPSSTPVMGYEDMPYRSMRGHLQQRLAALENAGVEATPAVPDAVCGKSLKAKAVGCYASQLRAFGPDGLPDVARPERLWHLRDIGGIAGERGTRHAA
jgi:LmbE family N-acetylglucosaminyl deacetylase